MQPNTLWGQKRALRFDNVFWQVLFEFCLLSLFAVLFVTAKKINLRQVQMLYKIDIGDNKKFD